MHINIHTCIHTYTHRRLVDERLRASKIEATHKDRSAKARAKLNAQARMRQIRVCMFVCVRVYVDVCRVCMFLCMCVCRLE